MSQINFMQLHGERVAYRDCGDGPAVVLLHGMGSSSRTWRNVIPELSEHCRVLAPDLLGHGQSAKPRTDYSLGAFAVWLRNFLDELDVRRATVVGHSLGGGIGMQFVHQHPDYCERLALISSGGLGPEVGWMLRLLAAPGAEIVLPLIAPAPIVALGDRLLQWLTVRGLRHPPTTETWEAFASLADPPTRHAFLRTLRSVVDYRGQAVSAVTRLNATQELPLLLMWGAQDPVIPVAHGHATHAGLPGSRLVVMPGVGHVPQLAAPQIVADGLVQFIATTEPWTPRASLSSR